jgi:hypothetical protein
MTKPNPLEIPTLRTEEEASEHRNFDCLGYDKCLGVACHKGWKGWSCRGCPFWQVRGPEQLSLAKFATVRLPVTVL